MKNFFLIIITIFLFKACKKQDTTSSSTPTPKIATEPVVQDKTYKDVVVEYKQVPDLPNIDLVGDYNIDIKKTTKYFFESDNIEAIKNHQLDANGVVMQPDSSYFPTAIAQMGIRGVNNYRKTSSAAAKQILLDQAKWAKDNFKDFGDYGFWIFTQPQPAYHIDKPWTSAMGQGQMISLLLGAYEVTEDKSYLHIIQKALKGFLIPLENGGFLRNWADDEAWFEEYATPRPSRVLNGAIFGLAGVYQVYEASGSPLALEIFNAGIKTLKNHMHQYDAGYSSRYNLADWKNEIVLEHYHEIHILQLLWLYKITGEDVFKKYATKFLENDKGEFIHKMSGYKLEPKIASILAKNCIDCEKNGTDNLTDGIWAYGNYWSSYKDSELMVDFGKIVKNIHAITLFHVNRTSSEIDFDVYALNHVTQNWDLKQRFFTKEIKDRVAGYNITSHYETFIEHYKIFEDLNTDKIKIVFHSDLNNVIAIREINFLYDRQEDIEYLLKAVDKRMKNIYD